MSDNKSSNMNSSGKVRTASSGAVRDNADNKPLMELLPLDLLMRVSAWYTLGAKKYGDNNWLKGQPQSWCVGSILRHLTKYCMGMRDEDHLSAIVFNALSMMNVDEYFQDNPELYNANARESVKEKHDDREYVTKIDGIKEKVITVIEEASAKLLEGSTLTKDDLEIKLSVKLIKTFGNIGRLCGIKCYYDPSLPDNKDVLIFSKSRGVNAYNSKSLFEEEKDNTV